MIRKATQDKSYARDVEQIVILGSQGVKLTKKTATLLDATVGTQLWYGKDEAGDVCIFKDNEHRGKLSPKLVINITGLNNFLLEKAGLEKIQGYRVEFTVSDLKTDTDGENTVEFVTLTPSKVIALTAEEEAAEQAEVKEVKSKKKNAEVPAPID